MIAQMFVQGSGAKVNIPAQFLSSLPYVATVLVLVLISRNRSTIRLNSPASLGQTFLRDA
jgi:simple sugar transport system permease protein